MPPPAPRNQDGSPPWFAYSDLAIWAMGRLGRSNLIAIRSGRYQPSGNDPVVATCALLRRLQRIADVEHIPLLVLMIYTGTDDMGLMDRVTFKQRPTLVAACARAAGIETLDLYDEMVRMMRKEPALCRSLYHPFGPRLDGFGHMTEPGNAFVAGAIAQRLRALGWLERASQHDAAAKLPQP